MNGRLFLRICFVVVTFYIVCPCYFTSSFSGFKLTSYSDRALHNSHCSQNITETKMAGCFQRCLSTCLCTSFQMCGGICQLCYVDEEGRQGILHDRQGCSYYNFTANHEKTAEEHCRRGCVTGINCCMFSQPCLNGGTCKPQYSFVNMSRFLCHCKERFTGDRCQHCMEGYSGPLCQTPIKSCRGYANGNRIAKEYKIFDKNMKLYPVMCDFDNALAWTLVQSFAFGNRSDFKSSFASNKLRSENSPNFAYYRLPKARMQEIAKDSSKWRITCDYIQGNEVSYTDYVQASLENVNILSFNGNSCVRVDYIDIRGKNCTNCTSYMIQSHNKVVNKYYMGLHFDSKLGASFPCEHDATEGSQVCGSSGEDDFGFFDCSNPNHRCSATETSTTAAWFGG